MEMRKKIGSNILLWAEEEEKEEEEEEEEKIYMKNQNRSMGSGVVYERVSKSVYLKVKIYKKRKRGYVFSELNKEKKKRERINNFFKHW